jgi:hypothetical protein
MHDHGGRSLATGCFLPFSGLIRRRWLDAIVRRANQAGR